MKHLPSARILAAMAALSAVSALADKTTNTFTKASNTTPITWVASGLPDITTSAGSDISIKIEYAEGYEKFQQLKTADTTKTAVVPLYLDSIIGGKYHDICFVNPDSTGTKYAVINDTTPFEGFWSIADGPARVSGIFLPDNGGAGPRTIGSAYLKGRFQFGVAAGCEAVVDYPFGPGMFEVNRQMNSRTPSGKITVKRSPGPYSIALVRKGTFEIVGGDDDISSPVPGAWARFDASAEDSFTFNGTAITQWRDADGRPVSADKSSNGSPTLYTDPETGKKAVNFGAFVNYSGTTAGSNTLHGGGARLVLSETRNDVAEMFVVFKDNDLMNGTYPQIAGDAFPRRSGYSDPNQLFKPRGELPKGLMMGEFRLDGQAVIPNFYYDFSRRMNVVSASYTDGGGSVVYLASPNNDGHSNYTRGGIKIAEIILYTNKLSSAERRHNNDYLMKKWKGCGVRDYGAIMLSSGTTFSVTSGTARVRELWLGTTSFTKNGEGTLEIESLNRSLNTLAVNGGAIRFADTLANPTNPPPAANPLAWFDAADTTTFDTFTSNYTGNAETPFTPTNYTFITSWRDKSGNGYTLHSPGLRSSSYVSNVYGSRSDRPAWPTLDTSTGAHPMVDLGPFTIPCKDPYKGNFGWITGISGLSTWLCLYANGSMYTSYGIRQGFVVFYKTDGRGNPINTSGWEFRNAGNDNPKTMFLHEGYAAAAALGGHWTYDGVTVNPSSVTLSADGKTHLGAFMVADGGAPVNVFGSDQNGGNSAGGCKIAEVILYDRFLTEQERLDTERYLMAKWNCGTHPADAAPSVTTLSFNNGTPAVIDTDFDMTIGTVNCGSSGTLAKKGTGTATVTTVSPAAQSALALEGGSLAVSSNMTISDGAVLDAYFDEEGNLAGTAAISGPLTIGGTATVRVHIPDGVAPEFGKYDFLTASQVNGSVSGWTTQVIGGDLRGTVSVGCDSTTGIIHLNVNPNGLVILFK